MFSIIIPTFNNIDYLKLCIESIKKNSNYKHEILFHINEGNDGTLEYIKKQGYKYTFSELNKGVCVAFNKCAKLASNKYILLNAPNDKIDSITAILPGMNSPSILPLAKEGWSSIHSVINKSDFWEIIDALKENGAEGILVSSIDNMVL